MKKTERPKGKGMKMENQMQESRKKARTEEISEKRDAKSQK